MVLPYINMNPPQAYTCFPSWTPLPPRTIPLGHLSAPAPSIQNHASNLDWRFVFWMLSFKSSFSLSSFTFIKRLFNSSSVSAISVHLFAYLRLLIFLLATLISAYDSSSLTFQMMYSVYKLNNPGDNMQPWCTLSPILNQSVVPYPVLTVASWSAYRFLGRL